MIVADRMLQEEPMPDADRRIGAHPQADARRRRRPGDSGAIGEVAKMLVAAENPLIIAGRAARTPRRDCSCSWNSPRLLQAPVQDRHVRMNFPSIAIRSPAAA